MSAGSLGDFWQLDVKRMAWVATVVAGTPEPRYGHAAVTAEGRIYVFGGTNGSGILFYVTLLPFVSYFPPQIPYTYELVRFLGHPRLSQFYL